ncbi:MAG: antibiotic biosynthesis monooxygenase [Sulfuricurvum sp.]|nr:antibiotic biosynthesis monooxygenase [Sulfuricurvum sp.]
MKYGIFGSITTVVGKRIDFIDILRAGIKKMPGNIKYEILLDNDDENKIWIYELWESKDHHEQSLTLPSVQNAIQLGRSMISDFGSRTEFTPYVGK